MSDKLTPERLKPLNGSELYALERDAHEQEFTAIRSSTLLRLCRMARRAVEMERTVITRFYDAGPHMPLPFPDEDQSCTP